MWGDGRPPAPRLSATVHFYIVLGEEVRDSYGSTYFEEEMDDRREKLKNNFWFRCICEACKKRWPCREDLPCNMFEVNHSFFDVPFGQNDLDFCNSLVVFQQLNCQLNT